MNIIIKDGNFYEAEKIATPPLIAVERTVEMHEIDSKVQGLTIPFAAYGDGWGFSIAKSLRENGFKGYLRARGHIIADQYPLALRSGFDDIEITKENAKRQGEQAWQKAYKRAGEQSYQQSLKNAAT